MYIGINKPENIKIEPEERPRNNRYTPLKLKSAGNPFLDTSVLLIESLKTTECLADDDVTTIENILLKIKKHNILVSSNKENI